MNLNFIQKLVFYVQKTCFRAQKNDCSILEIFKIVIVDFQIEDNIHRSRFFQKTFLVANTKFEVILKMLFLKLSNADVLFDEKIFTWKIYITNKALLTNKQVQIIDKKDFIIAALDANSKTFVIHVVIWKQEKMPMHSKNWAQVQDKT